MSIQASAEAELPMDSSRARLSTFETSVQPDPDQVGRPTSERLFDIAAALFCEKGYATTTTREIAAAAGIQQASLYYHVTSKEDLLHPVLEHWNLIKPFLLGRIALCSPELVTIIEQVQVESVEGWYVVAFAPKLLELP